MPKQTNGNKYLKLLIDHLETLDPTPQLTDVAGYLQIQKKSFLKYFPNPNNKNKIQGPFPLKIVRGLFIGFRFPAEKFLLSTEERRIYFEETGNKDTGKFFLEKSDFFTKWSSRLNDLEEFHHLKYSTNLSPEEKDAFLKNYSLFFEKYFQRVEKILGVYEYIGKGRKTMPDYLGIYEEAREKILMTIEEQLLKQSRISYTRYLALPYTTDPAEKNARESFEVAAQEALTLCSESVFAHIYRCLYNIETDVKKRITKN